jgi:hypothetical protein
LVVRVIGNFCGLCWSSIVDQLSFLSIIPTISHEVAHELARNCFVGTHSRNWVGEPPDFILCTSKQLIRLKRIYNFWCSMLVYTPLLCVLLHFVAFLCILQN